MSNELGIASSHTTSLGGFASKSLARRTNVSLYRYEYTTRKIISLS